MLEQNLIEAWIQKENLTDDVIPKEVLFVLSSTVGSFSEMERGELQKILEDLTNSDYKNLHYKCLLAHNEFEAYSNMFNLDGVKNKYVRVYEFYDFLKDNGYKYEITNLAKLIISKGKKAIKEEEYNQLLKKSSLNKMVWRFEEKK